MKRDRLDPDAGELATVTTPGSWGALRRNGERWAEALTVLRLHGDRAQAHIDERIRDLEARNDPAGVNRWREIAAHLDLIRLPGASA